MKKLSKMFWFGAAFGLSVLLLIAASGSGTVNTLPIWTGSTSLGDSHIRQDNGEILSDFTTLLLGPTNAEAGILIGATASVAFNGNGHSLVLSSGVGATNGGSLEIRAPDGSGPNGTGGSIFINAGQGNAAHGTLNFFSENAAWFQTPKVLPSGSVDFGSETKVWENGFFNVLTFGQESYPPDDAILPAAWIEVRIVGDTNEYRLPLYK